MAWSIGKSNHDPYKPMFAREHERHQGNGLSCPLGPILDMSGGGARVQATKKPQFQSGETVTLRIITGAHCVAAKAQVRWVKRAGRRFEVGFKFVDAPPSLAQVLEQLAKYGFVRPETTGSCAAATPEQTAAPGSTGSTGAGTKNATSGNKQPFRASFEIEDLYAMIGVPRGASDDEIAVAYRAIARQLHPDVNPTPEAQAKFVEITKAYRVLRDAAKRTRYDAMLSQAAAA